MAQPTKPPLSVRLPAETLAALKEEAARRKVTVNALVLRAVLKEIGQWSDEEAAAMRSKPGPPLALNKIRPAGPAPTVDVKTANLSVSIPVATNAPAPYGSRLKKR